MSPKQTLLLNNLATFPRGKGAVLNAFGNRIAGTCLRHGWVEVFDCGIFKSTRITDEGRKELRKRVKKGKKAK